jgi:hypothetical protein
MPGLFEDLKRLLTGEVVHRIDLEMGGGTWTTWTISLRLKRRRGSDEKYVVLAALSPGHYQYYPFELDEFDQFLDAAKKIYSAARSASSAVPASSGGSR